MYLEALNRFIKEDIHWLKWRLVLLAIALVIAFGLYFSVLLFRNEMRRQEVGIRTNTEVLQIQLEEIGQSERIIIENIDHFNRIVADTVMDEENRVTLLEDISRLRERHHLFPIDIEIAEQERQLLNYGDAVEFPDEQITLRSSQMVITLPLLHEEDLSRFFGDFLNTGRLLVANRCTLSNALVDDGDLLEVVEHQRATCEFHWFTLRREPFTGI
jgi:hypothetical protein